MPFTALDIQPTLKVRGTEIRPDDTREQYRQKLARITLDSIGHFVGLLDVNGAVLEINPPSLESAGISYSEVAGKPLWTTCWWELSDEARRDLRDAIERAARGESVRWVTTLLSHGGSKGTAAIEASLSPVRDDDGTVAFLAIEGRRVTEPNLPRERSAAPAGELAGQPGQRTGRKAGAGSFEAAGSTVDGRSNGVHGVSGASGVQHRSTKPRIVMLEEDAELNRRVFESLQAGYEVITTTEGWRGLEKAMECSPALIVLDITTTGRDGLARMASLRNCVKWAEAPILLLSAPNDEDLKFKLLDEGAADFLAKPFSERDLLVRVRNLIQLKKAQDRHRTLFESMDEGFCTVEVLFDENDHPIDYRFLEINAAFEKQTGLTNARGRRMRELVPRHEQHWFDIYGRIALHGESARFENCAVALGRWFEVYAFRVGAPEYRQVAILFNDITERKRAERAVQEAGERFCFMAESMPLKIFTADARGQIDYFNRQWMEFTGLTAEQMRRWDWPQFIHPDDVEEQVRRWRRSMETGEHFQMEQRIRQADGAYRWHLSRAHAMRDAEGKVRMWIGASTDIDGQKRAEEKLEETVAERTAKLRETIGELESFSYSIVHDMRAPLRSMQGFAELMHADYESRLDAEGLGYLKRISHSAARMDRLIQDVLSFGRVSRSAFPVDAVNTDKLVRDIVETYANLRAEQDHIRIEGRLPNVQGNESALTQCFSNLLGNAVKFVRPGAHPSIRVWAESHGERARIFVEDQGIGIPPYAHERIFGLFERATHHYEGTGLGLAIVKKAVERMGGTMGVQSTVGQGAKFWLELTLA